MPNVDSSEGIPIDKRKTFKKKKNAAVRGKIEVEKTYRNLETIIESKNMTHILVPGFVDNPVIMRIHDAKKRGVVGIDMLSELSSIDGLEPFDRIIVVPLKSFPHVIGGAPLPKEEDTPLPTRPTRPKTDLRDHVVDFPYSCVCGKVIQTEKEWKAHRRLHGRSERGKEEELKSSSI